MDTNETVVTQEQGTPVDTTTPTPSAWAYADGIVGQGDKPEWFKDSKYKSVSEQAQAYIEAEKRLGGFIGAPKEGYQLAEELTQFKDDPMLKELMPVLQESNASNDFVNKLVTTYATAQAKSMESYIAEQKSALGENADARLSSLVEYANVNIPQELQETFKSMATSAKAVEVMEALISKSQGSKVAPTNTTSSSAITPDKLREMMFKTNESGQLLASIDTNYKAKIDALYKEIYK